LASGNQVLPPLLLKEKLPVKSHPLGYHQNKTSMHQILIPTSKGTKKVMEQNIIRIEASSNYCKIYFINERPLVVAKVLHWFQDNLPGDNFCRIHRAHIINLLHVAQLGSASTITLTNREMLQISRRRKTHTGQLLKQIA